MRDAEAERECERTEADGAGEPGWEGGMGRTLALSSANHGARPGPLPSSGITSDSAIDTRGQRGAMDSASVAKDDARDRLKYESPGSILCESIV